MLDPRRLARLLVDSGRLTPEALRSLEEEQTRERARGLPPTPLPELLVRKGLVPEAELHALVAREEAYEATRKQESRIVGKFEIRGELGRGGMGVVFRAWQADLEREVALKLLPTDADADLKARFLREARLASKLKHPNILPVHELGEEAGRPYFTMELVDGAPFHQWAQGRPVREAAARLLLVARALHHAHAQGLVHRDVKPQNILVGRDGTPWLTDFGLAREVSAASTLTLSGQILGTPAFMSPEQARGGKWPVDARSDVYSLGAVLYVLLAGRPPFHADSVYDLLDAIVRQPPARPGGDPALERICLRCLEKDPEARYPTAEALAADLERALAAPPAPRRRLPAVALGLAAALIGVAVFLAPRGGPPAPSAPTPAPPASPASAFDPTGWEVIPATQRATKPAVAARGPDGLRLRNGTLRHERILLGDRALKVEARALSSGGTFAISLTGYRLQRTPDALVFLGPDFKELFRGPPTGENLGLELGEDGATALVDGKPIFRGPPPPSVSAVRPWISATQDLEVRISRVELSGAPLDRREAELEEQRRLFEGLGRSLPLGPAEDLLAGGGAGRFRVFESGRIDRQGDVLRATSDPGRRLELHGPHARASRLRFKYLVHRARSVTLRIRAGSREVNFQLPVDETDRWREVEAIGLESLSRCRIDGLRLASAEDDGSETTDSLLRLTVRDGDVSLKDAVLETVSGLPPEPAWTILFFGAPGGGLQIPPGWEVRDGVLSGSGLLPLPFTQLHFDLELIVQSTRGSRLAVLKGNAEIHVTQRYPVDGELFGVSLSQRAAKRDVLETWLFDELGRTAAIASSRPGPLELRSRDGPLRIVSIRLRSRS